MVTLSTLLMTAAVAPGADSATYSGAAIGSGNSTIILIALAVLMVGGVGSLVAGDVVRKREAVRRSQIGL